MKTDLSSICHTYTRIMSLIDHVLLQFLKLYLLLIFLLLVNKKYIRCMSRVFHFVWINNNDLLN